MTSIQMTDKRNQLMNEGARLVQTENVTPEARAAFTLLMKDVDILEADIANLKRIETFEAEQRSSTRPPRGVPGASADNAENAQLAKQALRNHMVTGETRDLGVGTVAVRSLAEISWLLLPFISSSRRHSRPMVVWSTL